MGSCHSTPQADNVVVPSAQVSKTETTPVTSVSGGSGASKPAKLHPIKHRDPAGSETEECESGAEDRPHSPPSAENYEVGLKDDSSGGSRSPRRKASKAELRAGYSSGGSSGSWEDEEDSPHHHHRTPSCNHLLELKHSISVGGDICKGVVRIETDYGRPIEDIYDGVHDGLVLGSGVAGIVRQVKHRKTGVNYAVKCLDLGLIADERKLQALRDEVGIMCQLDHPNIVRLEEVYESESEIFLIQELCTGGDLFDRLDDQSDFHYSESKCAKLVKQMLSAVRYLHSKNIIHRDLKLENFLFSSQAPDSELRMIDFGLSKHFGHPGELQHESVGTPYTVAPEIIRGTYDEKVDIWALGVITYLLLSGETPFGGVDGESLLSVRTRIMSGRCDFDPPEIWDHVSDKAKAFIRRLLNPDTSARPTAKEAQRDPWLQTFAKKNAEKGKALNPQLCQALVEFKEYSDMRKFLCEVLSFTLLPEQIRDLRREFEKVDPEGEGEISLSTLKQVLMESAVEGALGALTENEVEGIFNALRIRKTEAKIRWHEFIAAGLSQCDFDDRNLKLAFDRLDYDRKGFITLDDLKGLLGTKQDAEDEALSKMWEDGLAECVCPLGKISYDDFRMFIKGQRRDIEPNSPIPKRLSKRMVMDVSPLQPVPEGSMSPQAKHQVFGKFHEMSALESLNLPFLGAPLIPTVPEPAKVENANIGFPGDLIPKPVHKRVRSRSLGETPVGEELWRDDSEGSQEPRAVRRSSAILFPSKAICDLQYVIKDESKTALEVHKALYRKHREFRQSVLLASKLFDQKQKSRKFQIAQIAPENRSDLLVKRASLVMRRGAAPLKGSKGMMAKSEHLSKSMREPEPVPPPAPPEVESSPDVAHTIRVADAARRSGRPRRPRQKTASDISGMLR